MNMIDMEPDKICRYSYIDMQTSIASNGEICETKIVQRSESVPHSSCGDCTEEECKCHLLLGQQRIVLFKSQRRNR